MSIHVVSPLLGTGASPAKAEAAGLQVVMNRCPKMEYGKLSGEWAWVGGHSGIISSHKQALHESGKMQSLGLGPRKGY